MAFTDPGRTAGRLRVCRQVHGIPHRDLRPGIRGVARKAPAAHVGSNGLRATHGGSLDCPQLDLVPESGGALRELHFPESLYPRDVRAGLFGFFAKLRDAQPAATRARSDHPRRLYSRDHRTGVSALTLGAARVAIPRRQTAAARRGAHVLDLLLQHRRALPDSRPAVLFARPGTRFRRSGPVAGGADADSCSGVLASRPEPLCESDLLETDALPLRSGSAHHAAG